MPENPVAFPPPIRPIPTHSVPEYEARYANAIRSMETALKNRKQIGGGGSAPMRKFGFESMGDYDADGNHVAARGPSVRGVRDGIQ